VTVLLRPL